MRRKKICFVTGSRAEFGILQWLILEVSADERLVLQLVATGSHLSPEFGLTYQAIEASGLRIDRKVEMLLSSDTPVGVSKGVGLGIIGFADAFVDLDPDIVVVTGDRFEILAAAQAAVFAGFSLAHISGGEVTEGAVDDIIRHCLTKMARYHFVAAEEYRRRVLQLGEDPQAVFNVGDPGVDGVARHLVLDRTELSRSVGFDLSGPYFLVTYHPVTAGGADSERGLRALLGALDALPEFKVLITKPNADVGGRMLAGIIDLYEARQPARVKSFVSLGQQRYLSAMRHCAAVVGNSSSGIVEAPIMGKPVVNVGPRQSGRLKAASIIDCVESLDAIVHALKRATMPDHGALAAAAESPYGTVGASTRIRNLLATLDVGRNYAKKFFDSVR